MANRLRSRTPSVPSRTVTFANTLPSEREFFEEYDRYNASLWFFLIFILRCFFPFCLAMQIGLYEIPGALDLYIQQFSLSAVDDSTCTSKIHINDTNNLTTEAKIQICLKKNIALEMTLLRSVGTCLGALLGGILSDIFGRRRICLYSSVLFNLSSWVVVGIRDKLAGKFMHIFIIATGTMVDTISFVIFGEICSKKNRILSIYAYSCHVLGYVVLHGLVKTLTFWKYLLMFLASANILVVYACWYLPESPRWLFTFNKIREGYDQLNEISGLNYEPESSFEDSQCKRKDVVGTMAKFLFVKKLKIFIVICTSMTVASLIYNCANMQLMNTLIDMRVSDWLVRAAEIMGYLFLLPVYIFLGKRCGICFIFISISVKSLIALFVGSGGIQSDEALSFSIFSIMFGTAASGLNLLYFLDIFPTFLRCTTVGCSYCIFGATVGLSAYIIDKFADFEQWGYHLMFCFGGLFGTIVLVLPETANQDLPNFKPFE